MNREFFAGKNVLVMGLGRFGGGVDVAKFACGAGAAVTVTDMASADQLRDSVKQLEDFPDIEFHLGGHEPHDFEGADAIIVNPAIPSNNEFLKIARRGKKFITSQIEIFFQLCPATIIGITGANGKSTTAALTAHLLENGQSTRSPNQPKVWLSGNIGNKPLLTIVDQIEPDDLVVLELSSFQIEQLAQERQAPQVALLTNLTPNHLDRHGTFAEYCKAKENIFKFQNLDANRPAVSIFNAEDKIAGEWFDKYKTDEGRICLQFSTSQISEEIRSQYPLPGQANLSNLAAAVAVAHYFGVEDKQIAASLAEFKPLPHRLEFVAEINGVRWYNDSIATTPQSTIAALNAFDRPKIIIAGGYNKNLPFDELAEAIAQKTKAAVLIGQTAPKIAEAVSKHRQSTTRIEFANSLDEAVRLADQLAACGDVVLLSPGCASYDMFDNFQHRGTQFTQLVDQLNH